MTAGVLGRTLDSIPPAAGSEVMGTAIVSIALSLDGHETLSRVVLAIAAAIWVTLALLLPLRAARDPARFRADARTPGALTAPVATAVLGTRLTTLGWAWAGVAMLVIAFVLWVALLGPVLAGWKSPTVGVSLLLAVSAESLAVLAATLSTSEHARWLLIAALVPFGLGLGLYVFVIARFDLHQLVVGRGDHWITGGALGISSLAAARIAIAASALGILGGGGTVAAARVRRASMVDRVPARDVRGEQLRRRRRRPRRSDHDLRARLGLDRTRVLGDRLRGHEPACGRGRARSERDPREGAGMTVSRGLRRRSLVAHRDHRWRLRTRAPVGARRRTSRRRPVQR